VILLWGVPGDDPLDDVLAELGRLGADARLLDQRALESAEVTVAPDGAGAAGSVTAGGGAIDLAAAGAAYLRPQEGAGDPAAGAALVEWADLTRAAVVNRPAAMAANASKPFQLAQLARLGLAVPDTLVTSDPEEARRFRARHGRVVYKSASGVRSIVSELRGDRLERLDVATCPTQVQEHVEGEDVRVHVAGDEVLATLVRSDADDYRYASRSGARVELAPVELPETVAARCREAARALGLHLAGLDLRRTPGGEWVCFEANPSPAFTFYERATGQPLAAAVARLLVRLDASARDGGRCGAAPPSARSLTA
jgi:glutathione synthase/RimK-type ligase-like ATP-grasp enzyme